MGLTIVRSEDFDWIGLYRDGKLLHEGHSIQEEHLVKLLGFEYDQEVWSQEKFEEHGGCCPDEFPSKYREVQVVEDLSRVSPNFPLECDCAKCGSKLRIELADLEYARWKVGGYWFAGTEEIEAKYTFKCPACGCEADNEVEEGLIPAGTRQDLQAAYQARKDAGEPLI